MNHLVSKWIQNVSHPIHVKDEIGMFEKWPGVWRVRESENGLAICPTAGRVI